VFRIGRCGTRKNNPHVREILTKNKHRIKSIALVHEILYKHEDFANINIHEYLQQLSDTLLGIEDKDVQVSIEGHAAPLPFELVLRIGILANEMIVNTIKYALEGDAPSIRMRLDEAHDHYLFRYEDSGQAHLDLPSLQHTQSLGLRLIDMMVRQMDADLVLSGEAGLTYVLTIPK
jgi:two-component sensor histidine kinase